MRRFGLLILLLACTVSARGETLTPDRLGVIYDRNDAASRRLATYYVAQRHVPAANLIGLSLPERAVMTRQELASARSAMLAQLPSEVQSLLLVWSRPYAVECMSVTTAFAAGYQAAFCEPGCAVTKVSPLFDSTGWLPADTAGWLPAMLLPSDDEGLARNLIGRGLRADGTQPPGTVYLVHTQDPARNVRAAIYPQAEAAVANRVLVLEPTTPIEDAPTGTLAYFTGVAQVDELTRIAFRPGAVADHLTSTGGVLSKGSQMSVLAWLRQGATGSYGSVSEPCNHLEKFPNPAIFLKHYLRGDSLLAAYWKSVAMPGQGLFVGEPLARPYGVRP
jgi:uncharacterized protein (TIGR03790 family)